MASLQDEKVAIVTGANTGIGFETAKQLFASGYTVVLACRSEERARSAQKRICNGSSNDSKCIFMHLDLMRLDNVAKFAAEFKQRYCKLDVLVNNAGLNAMGQANPKTEDGFELCFGAHFLLTQLLLPLIRQSPHGRIVNLSSVMHRFGQTNWEDFVYSSHSNSYATSKLAMHMFAYELHRRFVETGDTSMKIIAVNPGAVNSDIWRTLPSMVNFAARTLFRVIFLSPEQGAATSIAAALADDVESGDYLAPYYVPDCCPVLFESIAPFAGPRRTKSSASSYDTDAAAKLYELSLKLVEQFL